MLPHPVKYDLDTLIFWVPAYGIVGDIDIESEIVRGLGSLRYTLYGLLRIANLRKYKAKIWYKKAETEIYSEAKSVSGSDSDPAEADRESNKTENSDEEQSEINFTKQEIVESDVEDHGDKDKEGKNRRNGRYL